MIIDKDIQMTEHDHDHDHDHEMEVKTHTSSKPPKDSVDFKKEKKQH